MGRESIIQSIRNNKPSFLPIPEIDETVFEEDVDLKETFINNVIRVGGSVKETSIEDIDIEIIKMYPHAQKIISNSRKSSLGNISITPDTNPHDLDHIDLAIIDGIFGVAENGAIWITEKQSIVRVLPFITDNLVIVLSKNQLYLHMLQAYDAIAQRDRAFGLFISGPSKTADIEQSLVIGAQGAMSLTVFLV